VARVLLVLPTSTYRAEAFLTAASRMSLELAIASEQPQALASLSEGRFLEVPLDEPEEAASRIAAFDALWPLDAVVAVDDQGLLSAALANERLGLPHNPPAAVAATRDKAKMRALFARAEVPQPTFELCERLGESSKDSLAAKVAAATLRLGAPVVIKPTGLSGSRGVIRADDPDSAAHAAERIEALLSRLGEPARLLVETYIPGEEVALEGLLLDGELLSLALFDKPDPLVGPYFEETIYCTPSRQPEEVQAQVRARTLDAARALGLVHGPIHAEIRLTRAPTGKVRPVVVELAARTIGGRCATALQFATGARLEDLVLAHAVGAPVLPTPIAGASGVLMVPIPRSGRLVAIDGIERAEKVPGVTGVEITVPLGQRVVSLPEGDRYLGFVFAKGDEPHEVEAALRAAQHELEVHIEPEARP
jgi:biotin carboxylase